MSIGWTDVHTHLNFLEISPAEAIEVATAQGVNRFITIGTEPPDWPVVLELANQHAPQVFCTLGIHPHEGKVFDEAAAQFLHDNLNNPRVVAVGEIGLDFYYNHSNRQDQLSAFRQQMEIAKQYKLPVEIHTRDAEDDTIEILQEYKGDVRGILHCFTGTQKLATAALDCGFNISYSGVVTFKKADELREVCKNTPLDRMHVETDAPFLAPTPLRGQKNQPDFMLWTALCVAELKGIPIADFARQIKRNAEAMFPRLLS
jgi:TatD DNase family protein